jgi:NedA-like, galactose-binding domain
VPSAVDDITCQALFQSGHGGGTGMTSPAALAGALHRVIPAPAPPPALPSQHTGTDWDEMPPGPPTDQRYWQAEPRRRGVPPGPRRPGGGPGVSGAMLGIGAVLVVLLVGTGVWILGHRGSPSHSAPPPTHSASSAASNSVSVLRPVSAHGFDALSSSSDDPGNENDQLANLAIDGNPSTSWNTQFYIGNPVFGGTKTGTGLILDMGKQVRLSSVRVTFGSIPGADVQIKLGNNNTRAPSTLDGFTTVASATNVAGTHTFTVPSRTTGRYVLIWFTKLPPQTAGSSNRFEAKVFDVVVRGSR